MISIFFSSLASYFTFESAQKNLISAKNIFEETPQFKMLAENDTRRSRLLKLFKCLRDIVVIGNNDFVIQDMNPPAEKFFGWSCDEVRGKSITFLVPAHPLIMPNVVVTLMATLQSAAQVPVVVEATRDPRATMVVWTMQPIRLPHIFEFGVHMNLNAALTPKLSVSDINFKGCRVFLRVDFNVPFNKATGAIRDDSRMRAAVPTITKILNDGGRVILASHLGRPKGPNPEFSLKRVLPRLKNLLEQPVSFCEDIFHADETIEAMKNGDVVLLENLRFWKGESSKVKAERVGLATKLASYADVYVCDAFGTVHRIAASMTDVPRILGAGVTGFLINKEIEAISKVVRDPKAPLVAVVGGAKVSDKINVLSSIFRMARTVIIGGAMAYTFLLANNISVGASKVEKVANDKGREINLLETARRLIEIAERYHVELIFPVDHRCAKDFKDQEPLITPDANIPEGYMGLDIGPKTEALCRKAVASAHTLIWNGPLGVFEFPNFAHGSHSIGEAIEEHKDLLSIVGGGETAAAAKKFRNSITHVSTGGGAFLELLEGRALPGLICLTARAKAKM